MKDRKVLNSWKELSAHMGRGVRTLQRWEKQLKMPVHRPAGKSRSAVVAFSDELDQWLDRTDVAERPYIRPVILVADPPQPHAISNRKLILEIYKFNVLTAFSESEVMATAKLYDIHGFILDDELEAIDVPTILEELKEQYPRKKVIVLSKKRRTGFEKADRLLVDGTAEELANVMIELFGEPRTE